MKYSEIFTRQWHTLCNDLKLNLARRKDKGLEAEKLDEWYRQNIRRWESSVETEGTVLEHQGNPELRDELLKQMKAFKFKNEEIRSDSGSAIKGILICLAGVAAGIAEYVFLPVSRLIRIGLAIAVIASAAAISLSGIKKSKEREYERIRKMYSTQLNDEGEKLRSLCEHYE